MSSQIAKGFNLFDLHRYITYIFCCQKPLSKLRKEEWLHLKNKIIKKLFLSTLLIGVMYTQNSVCCVFRTVLILINIAADYCVRAEDMTLSAHSLLHYLSELLSTFNSRSCKLVLGAEAVSEKTGLKKITSTNLALVLRALQLVLWLIPHIRLHFQGK